MQVRLDYERILDKFYVKLLELDDDQFGDLINFFKSVYYTYDSTTKAWVFKGERIYEFMEWSKRLNLSIVMSSDVSDMIYRNPFFESETSFKRGEKFDHSILTAGTKLFDFQERGVRWLISRNRAYQSDDAGTGKSLQTICAFSHAYQKGYVDGIVLLARNGLGYHWKREILSFVTLFKEDDIYIVDNKNKKNLFSESIKDKAIVIIPSHLWADIAVSYRTLKKGQKKSKLRWNKLLFSIKDLWQKKNLFLVIDEAHDFKNTMAVKSKALRVQLPEFDYRVLLSATPAINKFEDWYNQLAILDKGIIPTTENGFALSVASEIGDQYNPYAIVRYDSKKVEAVRDRIQPYVLKRLKRDLPEMKAKQHITPIYFDMTTEQWNIYFEIYEQALSRIEKDGKGFITARDIFVKMPYARQVIDNVCLLKGKISSDQERLNKKIDKWKFTHDPRLIYLDTHLTDVIGTKDEKVVIFDTHPLTIDQLSEHYAKYNPLKIHGQLGQSQEERQHVQDLFNDPKSKYKLLILSMQTSSAGLNLQKGSHRVIFFTQHFDSVLFRQAIDRTHRITSIEDTIISILVFDKTFDVVRLNTNLGRVKINDDFLNQKLTTKELKEILNGNIKSLQ